ncbi:hypothetical protein PENSPDRAFT_655480 [Peniophora sp. CONT]|nr:hypothetical protein PENSPDRAFT_655480 [Peniophora sp. CONT]
MPEADSPRGLPLLSGPVPTFHSDNQNADIACRKCNKEFNVLFTRARRCNHCGYHYCSSCTDYTALMPRVDGDTTGWDPVPVCGFCIENLNITAGGRNYLRSLPLSRLKRYLTAYNIKTPPVLEKDDLIEAIIKARGPNGCLSNTQEDFYRLHSVPNGRLGRPRGLFSNRPPPQPAQPNAQAPSPSPSAFARPDLHGSASSNPSQPPPQRQPPPSAHYVPRYAPPRSAPPPSHSPRPRYPSHPPSRPDAPRSASGGVPPRPATTAPATPRSPPPPVPSLDELLTMSEEAVAALSIGTLKAVLFRDHVNARLLLEKGELVARVRLLIEDERQERAREAAAREREEQEIIARQHAMMEEQRLREERLREERERAAAAASASEGVTEGHAGNEASDETGEGKPGTPPAENKPAVPPPPPPRMSMAAAERTGLCVICQDEEANIAIVDCGHMAMCRACSELVMASSRECPLCRTRIVTEQRLLRIFKT